MKSRGTSSNKIPDLSPQQVHFVFIIVIIQTQNTNKIFTNFYFQYNHMYGRD